MELLELILSSFWTWLGTMILVCMVFGCVVELVKALRRDRKIEAVSVEGQWTVKIENASAWDAVIWKLGAHTAEKGKGEPK